MAVTSHDGQLVRTLSSQYRPLTGTGCAEPAAPGPCHRNRVAHHGAAAGVVPGFARWRGPTRKDGDISA